MTLRLLHASSLEGGDPPGPLDPGVARLLPLHPGAMALAPAPGVLLPLPGLQPRLLLSVSDREPA